MLVEKPKTHKEGKRMKTSAMNLLFATAAMLAMSMLALGADATGKWQGTATAGKGGPQTFNLKQSGSELTGTVEGGRGGPVDIKNGKVDGDNISFDVTREIHGNAMTLKYSGKIEGDTLKLTVETPGGPREMTLKKQ
jgi:hypothetical protein